MSHASRIAFFLALACACAPFSVSAKGITVRFLANPPEDSVTAYAVMRAEGAGRTPVKVGEVAPRAAGDTLAFPDTGAERGHAYLYSIVALDASGAASDPSESTEVALPALGLPDTLRADAQTARWNLPIGADPLSGSVPLSLALEDSARFSIQYDSAARVAVFASRGEARSGWVVVRATYYGKFSDRDSIWLSFPAATALPAVPGERASLRLPGSWSPAQGALRVRLTGARAAGTLRIVTARGETVAVIDLPADGSEALWDGRDAHGRPVKPAAYLWAAQGPRGALMQSGSLRIEP